MSTVIVRKIVKGSVRGYDYRYLNVNGLVPDDWEHVKIVIKEASEDKVVIEIDKV